MTESDFKEKYQAAIPDCCELRTFKQHAEELLFCWGLAHQVKTNGPAMDCGICEYNNTPEGLAAREAWDEECRKRQVWDTLRG